MDRTYRDKFNKEIDKVFSQQPDIYDHRCQHPWWTGSLGDPFSGLWFVGENPSLGQLERATDPQGGAPTEEAQWWQSRGDQLFRNMLVKHGFKSTPKHEHGGWKCYITNVIKEADYAQQWNGSPAARRRNAANAWMPVFRWELEQSRPSLVVALGNKVLGVLEHLKRQGLQLPPVERIDHYSYVALRPRGIQGPMHPERVQEYSDAFARIAQLVRN